MGSGSRLWMVLQKDEFERMVHIQCWNEDTPQLHRDSSFNFDSSSRCRHLLPQTRIAPHHRISNHNYSHIHSLPFELQYTNVLNVKTFGIDPQTALYSWKHYLWIYFFR